MPIRKKTKADQKARSRHPVVEGKSYPFNLSVKYPAEKFPVLDGPIVKAVGRRIHSTGIDISTPSNRKPMRDLAFGFSSEKALNNAVKRLQKLKTKLPSIQLRSWED